MPRVLTNQHIYTGVKTLPGDISCANHLDVPHHLVMKSFQFVGSLLIAGLQATGHVDSGAVRMMRQNCIIR